MRRANTARVRSEPRSAQLPCTSELLASLARILITAGEHPEAMNREFTRICRLLKPLVGARGNLRSSRLNDAHVISHWYSDPAYLHENGTPRPLPLSGASRSLKRLIAQVLPHATPEAVVASLEDLGAVREEGGRYRPTGRYVSFADQREDTIFWLLTALQGVLQTIEHNAAAEPADRMVGRAAINPRFPVRALPLFHAGLRNHVGEFLKNVDGEMQRKEVLSAGEPTTELGVVVLAFENPQVTGRERAPKTQARKKARARGNR